MSESIINALANLTDYIVSPEFLPNFYSQFLWFPLFFPFAFMAKHLHHESKVHADRHTWKHILLAIDVPKDNEKPLRAVENLFAHLAGAHASQDLEEIHFGGVTQKWFSFEIVSIEGYVQFIIWTEKNFRNLIEAAIYAQYPDAEITEVEDYTKVVPSTFPNKEWDVWGADFKLVNSHFFPIRTYKEFEDMRTGEYLDPMHALLETMSRMGPGEQLWFQLLIKPIGIEWKHHAQEFINKMVGREMKHAEPGLLSKAAQVPVNIVSGIGDAIMNSGEEGHEHKKEDPAKMWRMMMMTPGEKLKLEAIEKKLTKIGFSCKVRIVYVGKKENFNKGRAVNSIVGAIKQLNTEDLNAIIPDMKKTAVTAHYVLKDMRKAWRKNKIMANYKSRSIWGGTPEYVLNIEELATLWHFPILSRTPSLKKTQFKKSEPPSEIFGTRNR